MADDKKKKIDVSDDATDVEIGSTVDLSRKEPQNPPKSQKNNATTIPYSCQSIVGSFCKAYRWNSWDSSASLPSARMGQHWW